MLFCVSQEGCYCICGHRSSFCGMVLHTVGHLTALAPVSTHQWLPPPQATGTKKPPHIPKCPLQVPILLENSPNHDCIIRSAWWGPLLILTWWLWTWGMLSTLGKPPWESLTPPDEWHSHCVAKNKPLILLGPQFSLLKNRNNNPYLHHRAFMRPISLLCKFSSFCWCLIHTPLLGL